MLTVVGSMIIDKENLSTDDYTVSIKFGRVSAADGRPLNWFIGKSHNCLIEGNLSSATGRIYDLTIVILRPAIQIDPPAELLQNALDSVIATAQVPVCDTSIWPADSVNVDDNDEFGFWITDDSFGLLFNQHREIVSTMIVDRTAFHIDVDRHLAAIVVNRIPNDCMKVLHLMIQ